MTQLRNDDFPPLGGAAAALADAFAHDDAVEHTHTQLWREWFAGVEWMRLRLSPVYAGIGVPRGHGEPVLLIPGFLCGDLVLSEMKRWLSRIGYAPASSRITSNTHCPNRTLQQLVHRVTRLAEESGRPVRVIGHSLGGMLAKCLVQAVPHSIDRVITLGSPIHASVRAHPAVIGLWDQLRSVETALIGRNLSPSCGSGHCTCDFVRHLALPKKVAPPQFSIYSRTDGVVDWSSCRVETPAWNTEVPGTHTGMAFSAPTYRAIAERLAEPLDVARRPAD